MGDREFLSGQLPCSWKRINVEVRPHGVSSSEPIAVLRFSANIKDVCNLNSVWESIAVRSFQYYEEREAESFLLTSLKRRSTRGGSKRPGMLPPVGDAMSFQLQIIPADGVVPEAYNDVVSFQESIKRTEETYSRLLRDTDFRSGALFSDGLLKDSYIDGLLSETRAWTRQILSLHLRFRLSYCSSTDPGPGRYFSSCE